MGRQRLSNNPSSSCATSACPGGLGPPPRAPSRLWASAGQSEICPHLCLLCPLDNAANNLAKHGASRLVGPGLAVALDHGDGSCLSPYLCPLAQKLTSLLLEEVV